jgi:hypothetical protein
MVVVNTAVVGKSAGKKADTARASMQNVRALVLNMQAQAGALRRLTDEPATPPGKAASTAVGVEAGVTNYASQRNGRLNDLRQKARLLETETDQLRQQLEGRGTAEVLQISRALYQESRSLQSAIERFPREPEAGVDRVLVARLSDALGKVEKQARSILVAYEPSR